MIDWERVNELREEVGAEDFGEVVDIFLEEVDEVIDRLRLSLNPSSYESDMHFLKGSALNLGFAALAALCSDGEREAATGSAKGVDIGAVIQSYTASKAEFLSHLGIAQAA